MGNSAFKTLGGVSPLKKGEKGAGSGKTQVRKQHAGDIGKEATATKAQDKSGYSRSGADFINVHSFTGNTRYTGSLASTLGPSLSSAVRGKGDFGDLGDFGNEQIGIREREIAGTTSSSPNPKYTTRWNQMMDVDDPNHDKYLRYVADHGSDAFAKWEADAKQWNIDNPGGGRTRNTKGYTEYQEYKIVDGEEIITRDWYRK